MNMFRILVALLLLSVPASARLSGVASSPASILSITANPPTGTITAIGAPETFTFCLSSAITVTGTPTVPIATSTVASSATYASGSGTKCLVFNYTTITNGAANPVATTIAGIVVGSATLTDANGLTPNLSGAKGIPFPGLVFAPGGGSGPIVNSVACSPATGLLTSTSGSNTATCTAVFSGVSMAVTGIPTLTLGNQGTPTVCPFSSVSGANVSFLCTFGAGSSTPISGKNTYLGTANSGAIGLPSGSGGFGVSGGNLVGPAGNIKKLQGIAVSDGDATFYGAPLAAKLRSLFPNINLIRLSVAPQGSGPYTWATPASLAPFVNAMTALGAVVVIENHDDNQALYTGSTLTGESAWYASLGTYYLGNPFVMYQTMNEPAQGDSAQMQATYNALRGTGYSGVIFIEAGGGAAGLGPLSTYVGSTTWMTSATNIAWDLHCYNWQSSFSTSVSVIQSDQNSRISLYQGGVTSASGVMPVVTLETGVSTNGSSPDAGGSEEITASFTNTNLQGASAWTLDIYNGLNVLTNASANSLVPVGSIALTSPYGTEVAGYTPTSSGPLSAAGGSATITSGGNNAVLSGASGIIFTGLSVNTSAAYFISTTGTDTGSGTGACSKASPCATLNFVRGLIEANSTKQVYVRGGNYTPSQTCSWVSDQGSHPTVSTVLCLTSADTNTAWLGYPGETPAFNGGATNSGNGVNDFIYLSGGIRGAIFNGLRANNFTFGDIEGNNAGYTITNNVFDGLFQPSGSTDSYGCVGMFEQIVNPDIEYNLCMNTQGSGIVVISDSASSVGVSGVVTVAHNILLNTCLSLQDCGALYAYDQSHTMANCSWSDNIIGNFGSASALASAIYFDDYMSNCAVYQNQLYADGNGASGQPSWMIHWHGGNQLLVNSNLLDMSGTFSSVSSHNPDAHYYQSATSGAGHGYNGDMDSNQFEDNIVYSTVAPFTSSCVGSSTLNCGYLWIWEFDGGTTINNPTVTGNAYRATTGSFTNLGSNPSQSSGSFGPVTELGAFSGNPGVSFSTSAAACGFGPAVPSGTRCYTATNPPGLPLLIGQGPH